jgi:hypothetical protein
VGRKFESYLGSKKRVRVRVRAKAETLTLTLALKLTQLLTLLTIPIRHFPQLPPERKKMGGRSDVEIDDLILFSIDDLMLVGRGVACNTFSTIYK